jgi:DNA-binding NarL/FixJ family response regulator
LSVAAKLAVQHARDADAQALALEYLALPDGLKEGPVTGLALNALGVVALRAGDVARARRYVTQAFDAARTRPEAGVSLYLPYVAAVAEAEGNLDEADQTYQAAVEHGQADDFLLTVGFGLAGRARIAHIRGDRPRARALYEHAVVSLQAVGALMPQMAQTHAALGCLALEEGQIDRARADFASSLAMAARLGHRDALVTAFEGAAAVLAGNRASQTTALRLSGAARRLREGALLTPAPAAVAHALQRAQRAVGEPRASMLVVEGRSLPIDEATALARAALVDGGSPAPHKNGGLTPREREVAILLARGCSNRELAEALVVGQRTAEMHVSNLLAKLGLTSRSQVAVWAVQNGLVTRVP